MYPSVLAKYLPVLHRLDEIVAAHPEPYLCEGSVWCLGGGLANEAAEFRPKREALTALGAKARRILEIGFNAGHSTVFLLGASDSSVIVHVDVGEHPYARPCYDYLANEVFRGRMLRCHWQDSRDAVPALASAEQRFDLVHVDGGHTTEIALADIRNCARVVDAEHAVVLDDADNPQVAAALDAALSEGLLAGAVDSKSVGRLRHWVGAYDHGGAGAIPRHGAADGATEQRLP